MDLFDIERAAPAAVDWLAQHRTTAVTAAGVLALLLAGLAWWLRGQRGKDPLGRVFDAAAVVVAVALSAEGMWEAATERLHLRGGVALLLFAFAELAMLRAARRARAKVAAGRRPGIYGLMVWGIALGAGLVATSNAPNITEHLIRFGAPLLVAAQWWADLVDELWEKLGHTDRPVSRWIWTPQRIGVELGWLRPGDGDDLDEVFERRRVNKMVRLAGRIDTGWRWLAGRRMLRLRRLAERADEAMMAQVRERYLRGASAVEAILGALDAAPTRTDASTPATLTHQPDAVVTRTGDAPVTRDAPVALTQLGDAARQPLRPAVAQPAVAPARRVREVVMRRPVSAPPADAETRDAALRQAVDAVLTHGSSIRGAARDAGLPEVTVRRAVDRAKAEKVNGQPIHATA